MIFKKIEYLIAVVFIVTITLLGAYLYHSGEIRIQSIAIKAFIDAVDKELDYRFSTLDIPFVYNPKAHNKNYQNLNVITDDGVTNYKIDSIKEKNKVTPIFEKRVKQTIASSIKSISPMKLDSFWQEELINRNIYAKTSILINASSDSVNNCNKNFITYYAGLENEIEIKTHIQSNISTIIYYGNKESLFIVITIILLMIIWSLYKTYSLISKNSIKPESIYFSKIPPELSGIKQLNNGMYVIDKLIYEPEKTYVIYEKEKIKIRPQISKLLMLFLNSPDNSVKTDDIIKSLWTNSTYVGIENRLQRVISDLRKFLQIYIPDICIELHDNYYRLYIKRNNVVN